MIYPQAERHFRVQQAVRRNRALSREGLLERVFEWLFHGLVYAQIWEDPEVDLEALALTPQCHVVAIASGGCNVLSYLTADPARITAVDLSRAHVALNRLKLVAASRLPSWEAYRRFFAEADDPANVAAYDRLIAPHLDGASRAYWEGRTIHGLGRRRISIFARNAYRHGVLGRFIGLAHAVARLHGVRPRDLLKAESLADQRRFFEEALSPLFDRPVVRWATERRLSLYGLGIPPAQYEALAGGRSMGAVLRERIERLACSFSLTDNYFTWQAFGRGYGRGEAPLPPYLRREQFDLVRARGERVEVRLTSITDHLASLPASSRDRYVLLDAQDWMTAEQMTALWTEIDRTADDKDARVIFRTAGKESPLPKKLPADLLGHWLYLEDESRAFHAQDRSSIYGGFHVYARQRPA